MKTTLFIFFAIILLSCTKNDDPIPPQPEVVDTVSTGWKKIQLPTSNTVVDIFFISNSTGFAIAGNSIFRSIDGGNNWQKVYDAAIGLHNIGMGSANNAMFTSQSTVAGASRIYYTNDGGASFQSVDLADTDVKDAFFVNGSTAYAAGQNSWKSVNGGQNWTKTSSFTTAIGTERYLYFVNEQTGWTTGSYFFKTLNGTATWTNIPATGGLTFGGIGTIHFVDNNTGYVTDPYSVNKTLNGGDSFTKVFTTWSDGFHDIHFVDAQTGYLTDAGHIFKTTDGGQNWTTEIFLKDTLIIETHFTDASHGWAGATGGLILKYEQ